MRRVGERAGSTLRRHQREALAAIEQAEAGGRRRAWVVLPPGAGKTLVGLETACRRGRTTVTLSPNTAIQSQWVRAWDDLDDEPAGTSRELHSTMTSLTYQALATFDTSAGDGDDTVDREQSLIDGLHPHGRALVERLKQVGDLTLVLDECHHLLEVWGRLVEEVLDELPDAFVLGLTATPASTMTKDQQALTDELFGEPVYAVSIPAVVREGDLAPYAELAWLTTPSPTEEDWLRQQGERFAELTTSLTDPGTGFLDWLDGRFETRTQSWVSMAGEQPELTDAALRAAHHGLMKLPDGARLTERHRHDPTADDWVLLIEAWLDDTGDQTQTERIRQVLPSVGYQLTRRGIRRGRTPVDRVLARSESKSRAMTEIVEAEHRNLGERLRMLVLCDHERATATLPVDLRGVVDERAGSATLALQVLEERVPQLSPLLVTGTTVAGSAATMSRLAEFVGDDDLMRRWTSREWVPWVTRFFEAGHTQVLVGTRGLLGEGWDARAVTGLVDLTSATTSAAVVQTRGRALRRDPAWPGKVAVTWTVCCVTEEHPKGSNDWDRLVRKHESFFGLDAEGAVVSGVGHLDASFSPYAPPAVDRFAAINAGMLARSELRSQVYDEWAIGTPYDDRLVHTVRIAGTRETRDVPVPVVIQGTKAVLRDRRPSPWRPHPLIAVGLVLAMVAFLLGLAPVVVIAAGVATMAGIQTTVAVDRGRLVAEDLARPPSIEQVARAVADGLHAADLSPVGAEAVTVETDDRGERRCALHGVDAETSRMFATALDEAVSPMTAPRYVVPRWLVLGPVDNEDGVKVALGRIRPDAVVWHSVPTVLGTTADRAKAFARAWDHWVGGGPLLYTGSPEGEGVLVTHRGSDPFDVTTSLRTEWS